MNMDETKAPRTLVGDILKSKLPATDKTHKRLSLETGTITAAAFETTAHTMRNLVYYVYTDATVLSKLRDELVKALNGRDISDLKLAELEQLPYLTAVVMEGLRLSPALFTRMGRIAPDRELIYADKWIIPANTPVSMTTMMMHWDETIYLNARSFDPERWMDPEARRKADKTFAPFSRGTRVCVGMQ
jgi:cytochrome P450